MRILVVGGAGYVGSTSVETLVARGHEVAVFDNLSSGHAASVVDAAPLIVGDIHDGTLLEQVLREKRIDAVLHCAARSLVGESMNDPGLYYHNNVAGGVSLLEAMKRTGVGRLVFSSTAAVYGEPRRVPIAEADRTEPINPYGATKLAFEGAMRWFAAAHDFRAISLRYFNVAGASRGLGEDHDPETHLIPNILRTALGVNRVVDVFGTDYPTPDGTAIRDYIHIEDLAAAHLLALEGTRAAEHQIFNLGNGTGFSVREVIDAARRVTGAEIPTREAARRPGDPPKLVAASEKIQSELGWKPEKPKLTDMVGDAWAFAQAHPRGYSQ